MVPAKRNSKSKVGRRRAHLALDKIALVVCPECRGPVRPHRACPQCGMYRGRSANR
ncbi:50S ribosomal protein L32 [Candidatus Uhrbacteria bacterium]|nr:50S ribosomal protein L32 [Candidatus Uhrbacteria bacterium]